MTLEKENPGGEPGLGSIEMFEVELTYQQPQIKIHLQNWDMQRDIPKRREL